MRYGSLKWDRVWGGTSEGRYTVWADSTHDDNERMGLIRDVE